MKFTGFGVFAFMMVMAAMIAPSQAQETIGRGYSTSDYRSLLQTYMGLYNAGNPTDEMLDEYAEMTYCELYKAHYNDDFEWAGVRRSIRNGFTASQSTINRHYEIVTDIKLGRYDLEEKHFPILEEDKLKNIGKLSMYLPEGAFRYCERGRSYPKYIPSRFFLVLPKPINLTNIPIPEKDARTLVNYITLSETGQRTLYLRFRAEIIDYHTVAPGTHTEGYVDFHGHLTSVDVFLDPELSQKVYSVDINR